MWWSGSEARGTNEALPRAQCLPGRVESEASRLGRRRRALFIVEDAGAARDDVYIYTCGERWTWGLFWSGSLRNPEVPTLRQCEAGSLRNPEVPTLRQCEAGWSGRWVLEHVLTHSLAHSHDSLARAAPSFVCQVCRVLRFRRGLSCGAVTAPERKDVVIVTSPLVSPGTTLDEPMAHEDNTDEQRACGRTSVEVIPTVYVHDDGRSDEEEQYCGIRWERAARRAGAKRRHRPRIGRSDDGCPGPRVAAGTDGTTTESR